MTSLSSWAGLAERSEHQSLPFELEQQHLDEALSWVLFLLAHRVCESIGVNRDWRCGPTVVQYACVFLIACYSDINPA